MRTKFKLVVVMVFFLGAILLSGCATKQEENVQQTPPPQPTCEQKCNAEYDECYAICDADPTDDYCYWGFCEDDRDDCLAACP